VSQFNLSSIPPGSTVSSARLHLYVITRETSNRGLNLDLHALTSSWVEDGVTWGYRNLGANQTWTGGGTIGSTLDTVAFPAGTGWMVFDVPVATVQVWINAPSHNHGLVVKSTSETHTQYSRKEDFLRIATSEYGTVTLRPKLEVTFTPLGNLSPLANLTIDPQTVVTPGHHTRLTADASDPDGTVERVEFYVNSQLVGTDTTAPYTCMWASTGKGDQSVYVKAFDDDGGTGTSETLTITAGTVLYSADMSSDPGWQTEGQWEYGTPSGVDGYTIDGYGEPSSGYTGSKVFGYELDSPYYVGTSTPKYTRTPAIDCSGYVNVTLSFRCWLGAWFPGYNDSAALEASSNGSNWTTVWENQYSHCGGSWPLWSFDISSVADGQSTVYVRWKAKGGTYRTQYAYSGWNLDDVRVVGEQILAVDTDGDGMPNDWEEANNLDPDVNDANGDSDGDGVSNYDEFVARTNPGSATSRLAIASTSGLADREFRWYSVSGQYYAVQTRTNILTGSWTTLLDNISATPPMNTVTVPVSTARSSYYRITLE